MLEKKNKCVKSMMNIIFFMHINCLFNLSESIKKELMNILKLSGVIRNKHSEKY